MRTFITLLLFALLLVLGTRALSIDANATSLHATQQVLPLDEHASSSSRDLWNSDSPYEHRDVEYADANTLASRLSVSAQRMTRFLSQENYLFLRGLLRQMALHSARLVSCQIQCSDASNTLGWTLPCEHYVFGLRRLLI